MSRFARGEIQAFRVEDQDRGDLTPEETDLRDPAPSALAPKASESRDASPTAVRAPPGWRWPLWKSEAAKLSHFLLPVKFIRGVGRARGLEKDNVLRFEESGRGWALSEEFVRRVWEFCGRWCEESEATGRILDLSRSPEESAGVED